MPVWSGWRRSGLGGFAFLVGMCAWLTSANAEEAQRRSPSYVTRGGISYLRLDPDDPDAVARLDTRRIVVRAASDWTAKELERRGVPAPRSVGSPLPGGYRVLEVPRGIEPFDFLRKLEASPGISWARFDVTADYFFTPNDPLYPTQWGLSEAQTRMPSAWNFTTGGPIKVAIIDSGAEASHPDLVGRIDPQSGQFAPVEDLVGHGTSVTGIVGATSNNGEGVAGVAGGTGSGGVSLLVLTLGETPTASSIAAAITYAADHGARVINMSLGWCVGGDADYPEVAAAITYATDPAHDVVIVCAAGQGCKYTAYPAKSPKCIAVRAIMENGTLYGSYGPGNEVDILAPGGGGIATTDRTGVLGYSSGDYTCIDGPSSCFGGTSAASPFIAGVVALMRSVNPALTRTQVFNVLVHSADKLSGMNGQYSTPQHGYGKVNALGAVVGALYDAQLLQGTYATAQTWPDPVKPFHNLYLPGDVLIDAGATAAITPKTDVASGVNCYLATSDAADLEPFFTDKVELIVKGTLQVNGTSTRRVTFRSVSNAPTESDWAHLYVINNGNVTISNADFKHSQYGISSASSGSLGVTNAAFLSNANTDLKLGGSPSSCTISSSSFTVGGGTGVEVQGGSVNLSGNTFGGLTSTSNAIHCDGGTVVATVSGNQIVGSGTGTGIWLGTGSSTLTGNSIQGCGKGILLTSGPHQIGTASGNGNTLQSNAYGVYAQCNGPGTCPGSCAPLFATLRWNTFTSNPTAVHSVKTAAVDLGTSSDPGNNSLVGSDTCVVNNTSSCGTITAQGNWWGQCAAPANLCGSVDASGFLCEPPGGGSPLVAGSASSEVAPRSIVSALAPRGTALRFHLSRRAEDVSLTIHDVAGRRVRVLRVGELGSGDHSIEWDGRDAVGARVGASTYFVRVRADGQEASVKVLVLSRR
jgi:subtilisin family serine protease